MKKLLFIEMKCEKITEEISSCFCVYAMNFLYCVVINVYILKSLGSLFERRLKHGFKPRTFYV